MSYCTKHSQFYHNFCAYCGTPYIITGAATTTKRIKTNNLTMRSKTKTMQNIINVLKSRTVLAVIVLFLINGVSGIHDLIPAVYLPYLDFVISGLAVWYRTHPVQQFNA